MTEVPRVQMQAEYNPSKVLADSSYRDEYDFLFSNKVQEIKQHCIATVVATVKDATLGFVEMLSGSSVADPAAVGEVQRKATTYAAGFQSSLGLAKVFTGDIYSGVYNMLLGVLGVSCSREGKSKDMLKTYVVITFINGCVQAMEVVQVSLAGISLLGKGLPFALAVGHAVTVLNPVASFMGAYLGWQFVKTAKQQYMIALAHYQLQMLMMHQQQQMAQAAVTQPNGMKRLPTITEADEENSVRVGPMVECTGGSTSVITN